MPAFDAAIFDLNRDGRYFARMAIPRRLGLCATADTALVEKRLIKAQCQATVRSEGRQLGESRLN